MSFLSEVAADCKAAEVDLGGATVTWNGTDYPVAATTTARGATLIVGGKEVDVELVLRVRYTGTLSTGSTWTFTTLPKAGEKVTYKTIVYRILQVRNAHEAFLELAVGDAHR